MKRRRDTEEEETPCIQRRVYVSTQKEGGHLQNNGRVLTRSQHCWNFDLGFSLQNWRKINVCHLNCLQSLAFCYGSTSRLKQILFSVFFISRSFMWIFCIIHVFQHALNFLYLFKLIEYMPIICVISESVSIGWFFSSFWVVFSFLFACLIIFYWMTDIVNFMFLDDDFFVVFKCVYPGMLLSYLETVWSFQNLFLSFVR